MSIGVAALSVVEAAAFLVLHLAGIFPFAINIVLGIIGGCAVAILNFTVMCITIQKAVGIKTEKAMQTHIQFSYNARLFIQAGWVVFAFLMPWLNAVAAAIPLTFPSAIIFYLQKKGTLTEPSERKNPEHSDDEPEDHLESFEI